MEEEDPPLPPPPATGGATGLSMPVTTRSVGIGGGAEQGRGTGGRCWASAVELPQPGGG